MVKGILKFKEYFLDYAGKYVFIGGTACDLILGKKDVDFRVTKDLDIVLVMEALDEDFVNQFVDFITAGGYKHIKKGSGENQFYRFESPVDNSFPAMIEVFSKRPDYLVGFEQQFGPIYAVSYTHLVRSDSGIVASAGTSGGAGQQQPHQAS